MLTIINHSNPSGFVTNLMLIRGKQLKS